MSALDDIQIDMTIVLGSAMVPIRQILHMGRGATIALDSGHDDPSLVYVNGQLVARGKVLVNEQQMSFEILDVTRLAGA